MIKDWGKFQKNICSFHSKSPCFGGRASVDALLFLCKAILKLNFILLQLYLFYDSCCQCLKECRYLKKARILHLKFFHSPEILYPTLLESPHLSVYWYFTSKNTSPSKGTRFKLWFLWLESQEDSSFLGNFSDIFHFNKT